MLSNIVILCLFSILIANCAEFPKYISKCKISDPKLNDCLRDQANKMLKNIIGGDDNFGIPVLQQIRLPRILVTPSKTKEFHIDFRNCYGRGIEVLKILELKMDQKFQTIEMIMSAENPVWTCTYKATGELLNNTIDDRGFIDIIYTDLVMEYTADYDSTEVNSTYYYTVKNDAVHYPQIIVVYNLTHIDGSDQTQAKLLTKLFNEDYKEFSREYLPMTKVISSGFITGFINNIFGAIPVDQLFDP